MTAEMWFITGTDTGVGKTVLTSLIARYLRSRGLAVAALKPFCSGGRGDARELRSASNGELTLDEINPWAFRAPLTPLLAARMAGKRVMIADTLAWLRKFRQDSRSLMQPRVRRYDFILIEGAGGLLSPLGEGFDARDLIVRLNATPLIVCPNRLGAVNQALLAVGALPRRAARKACVVLMPPRRADSASRTNPKLLIEFLGERRVFEFPRLKANRCLATALNEPRIRRTLEELMERLFRPGASQMRTARRGQRKVTTRPRCAILAS